MGDWTTAEAERERVEREAAKAQEDLDWSAAKDAFTTVETQYNNLQEEVKVWREMRDAEPDLELWREYDKGLAEAKERLEALQEDYDREERWWNDMQQMKTAREEEEAFAAAAAAAEAMYTARQAEITTAQAAVDAA